MAKGRPAPGTVEEWLARAGGDLALAGTRLPDGGFYEDLCFHAHQAAEKAIKAVYIHNHWLFEYTHDLEELLTGLKVNGLAIPERIQAALGLTTYAYLTRYPGLTEPVSEADYRVAMEQATTVMRWTEGITGRR